MNAINLDLDKFFQSCNAFLVSYAACIFLRFSPPVAKMKGHSSPAYHLECCLSKNILCFFSLGELN